MKDIWTYSLKVYAKANVAQSCLAWQAEGGNVPLLLFVAWYSRNWYSLPAVLFKEAAQFSDEYSRLCVSPLRAMRQQMKQHSLSCIPGWQVHREQVKQWELAAERYQLEQLASMVASTTCQPSDHRQDYGFLSANINHLTRGDSSRHDELLKTFIDTLVK